MAQLKKAPKFMEIYGKALLALAHISIIKLINALRLKKKKKTTTTNTIRAWKVKCPFPWAPPALLKILL